MRAYDTATLNYRGLTFTVAKHYDEDHQAPWIEHDGHGIVLERKRHVDDPDEARELNSDYLYDWRASLDRAREEGWGLGPKELAKLRAEYTEYDGRELPQELITQRAVRNDYEYLRAWCRDEWHYCGIVVKLDGAPVEHSLWGIESDDEAYHNEVARELADEIISEAPSAINSEIERLQRLAATLPQEEKV